MVSLAKCRNGEKGTSDLDGKSEFLLLRAE
jgi:hypothetical protein